MCPGSEPSCFISDALYCDRHAGVIVAYITHHPIRKTPILARDEIRLRLAQPGGLRPRARPLAWRRYPLVHPVRIRTNIHHLPSGDVMNRLLQPCRAPLRAVFALVVLWLMPAGIAQAQPDTYWISAGYGVTTVGFVSLSAGQIFSR